ncbi:hypothetical protein [Ectobacillus ponti]|uniref:Lipoprotein n=1 Tax=Ectobacillus ponti TaxID=2961894 RepID=A0AA42BQB6_9BACI|nr:hypothetical protein [Ectobacillus ponti]MCP8969221.1 hypothetical protein [Ectobacillus ponti]
MKKTTCALLAGALLALGACSANDKNNASGQNNAGLNTEQRSAIDNGLKQTSVKVPASMLQNKQMNAMFTEAEKRGAITSTRNADGSLTYSMNKTQRQELMRGLENTIAQNAANLKNNKNFGFVKDVTYNKSFSQFTITVDRAAYQNSVKSFPTAGLGMSGMLHQLYKGVTPGNNKVTVQLKDADTQQVFDTIVYPDDLKQK